MQTYTPYWPPTSTSATDYPSSGSRAGPYAVSTASAVASNGLSTVYDHTLAHPQLDNAMYYAHSHPGQQPTGIALPHPGDDESRHHYHLLHSQGHHQGVLGLFNGPDGYKRPHHTVSQHFAAASARSSPADSPSTSTLSNTPEDQFQQHKQQYGSQMQHQQGQQTSKRPPSSSSTAGANVGSAFISNRTIAGDAGINHHPSQTAAFEDDTKSLESPVDDSRDQHRHQPPPAKKKRVIKARPPAPEGVVITDKSCKSCRVRKVKCDRMFPLCANCKQRGDYCDLISLHPKDKQTATARDLQDAERITQLESRLADLESYLRYRAVDMQGQDPTSVDTTGGASQSDSASVAALSPVQRDQASVGFDLKSSDIARNLSRHLCQAFFDSSDFQLSAFDKYRDQLQQHAERNNDLESTKVAIAVFCAMGARIIPYSTLLGIDNTPEPGLDIPLIKAGQRRQATCQILIEQAHTIAFQQGLTDHVSVENLAALLVLTQMSCFEETLPIKSRTLLRTALGQFKELQDSTKVERRWLQERFGITLYSLDAFSSARARRLPLIMSGDLDQYFDYTGLIEEQELVSGAFESDVQAKFKQSTAQNAAQFMPSNLESAVACCQRAFAQLVAPSTKARTQQAEGVESLLNVVKGARSAIAHVLQFGRFQRREDFQSDTSDEQDVDWLTLAIRADHAVLELILLLESTLSMPTESNKMELPRWLRHGVTREARNALKTLALYMKHFATAAPYLTYRLAQSLEMLPQWTQWALRGHSDESDANEACISMHSLNWLLEGLQQACYYAPATETRLQELLASGITFESPPLTEDAWTGLFQTWQTG
ncbi:hypothetical protein OIO90_003297 [Microbotryomycetes sp. JL221]|nr:hypothetical protein OIO90_003297 [Microbotryomycetes sp. JL221]